MPEEGSSGSQMYEFFEIVRASYTREEMHEFIVQSNLAVRVAKIRGLIPWEYDGERADVNKHTTIREMQGFDFPTPPQWGEAA